MHGHLDDTTMSVPKTSSILVDSVDRPTANLGTLTGDAMLRMGNGMRAKFDENDEWRVRKGLVRGTDHAFRKGF